MNDDAKGMTPGTPDSTRGLPPEQLPTVSGPLTGTPDAAAPAAPQNEIAPPPRQNVFIKELLRSNWVTTILAIVAAMIVGGASLTAANTK